MCSSIWCLRRLLHSGLGSSSGAALSLGGSLGSANNFWNSISTCTTCRNTSPNPYSCLGSAPGSGHTASEPCLP
ncbi:hypothetical protein B0H17DRAFT_1109357 [Mycena rosella]|uniref:Secreted protein n=1 Tax=Mycena rosella TaxID=1033263 RepID=A0AAD7FNX8_MYCRO|nr:hypothetical protein B0H17DRAFT_1109357 [Mycena rosella]